MIRTDRPSEQTIEETFIQRWGDMAAAWGINRTMGEIQGLLYITGATLCTDEIMKRLGISRGNASMSLRALIDWGVVERVHHRGDRRDYYRSLADVWEIITRVARQRKRKEIDPALETLKELHLRVLARQGENNSEFSEQDRICQERLEQMLQFLTMIEELAERFIGTEKGLARAVGLLAGNDSE